MMLDYIETKNASADANVTAALADLPLMQM